ncbi:MAG TPA: hypothetical protein VET90_04255 [Candidatus Binatus sp.]|nr:hypothetical protein [Candidatus Binatus sp.]
MVGQNGSTGLRTTAAWRPMAFGDGDPRTIADPLFEPRWRGRRALVEVAGGAVTIREVDLGERPRSTELRAALAAACGVEELLLDGYLVPGTLDAAATAPISPSSAGVTRGGVARHMLLGSLVRSRPRPAPGPVVEPAVTLPADGPIAFAAVDLLWLDGEPLVGLPLGERKRLLESVVADGDLVRRTASVRAPAERWQGQWRALGFEEMAVKAANGRYVPGGTSPDWTIVPIPRP